MLATRFIDCITADCENDPEDIAARIETKEVRIYNAGLIAPGASNDIEKRGEDYSYPFAVMFLLKSQNC